MCINLSALPRVFICRGNVLQTPDAIFAPTRFPLDTFTRRAGQSETQLIGPPLGQSPDNAGPERRWILRRMLPLNPYVYIRSKYAP